jgi:uncharacterized cupredoxin-like copper-binding protein
LVHNNSKRSVLLAAGESKNYTVEFTIPTEAEIKDYTGKFKATSEKASIGKDFTLRVLPSEEKKKEINSTIAAFSENATKVGDEIEELRKRGYNVTIVQDKFSKLLQLLSQAKTAIQNNDFFTAYQLIDDIKEALESTVKAIEDVKKVQKPPARFKWILIALTSLAVGVLVYLFWPEGEEGKEKALQIKASKFKKGKNAWNKLKEKWGKKKEWSTPEEKTILQRIKEKISERK